MTAKSPFALMPEGFYKDPKFSTIFEGILAEHGVSITKKNKVIGVSYNGELAALCVIAQAKNPRLDFLWTTPKITVVRKFVEEFKTPPARYFLEHLIRQGATLFSHGYLHPSGARFFEKLYYREGMLSPAPNIGKLCSKKVEDKFKELAKSRSRVL